MSPDPYAPKDTQVVVPSEVETPLQTFVRRLRALGADDESIALLQEGWDDFDDDWTPERRDRLLSLSDFDLLAEIRRVEVEYDHDTTTPAEADEREQARLAAVQREATTRMDHTVPTLLNWVGDDEDRAWAVLELERLRGDNARSTLTGPLEQIIG